MAEIAIPLVALGGLYILSNQDKNQKNKVKSYDKNEKNNLFEGFSNLFPSQQEQQPLKVVSSGLQEQPISQQALNQNFSKTTSGSVYTDKYFDSNNYAGISQQQTEGAGIGNNFNNTIQSLTGDKINKSDFRHNNMVPYFGAKIRGATADSNLTEAILDNKQGTGSQHFTKEETAPLFKPEENMNWQHGAPNNSDFYQSRMNESNTMNNVTLWEQQRVAPGLGLGYTTDGQGGFNSSLVSRDMHMPRSVDDLRISENPKITYQYNNPQGPGQRKVQNLGMHGKVEKHLPDKFYQSGPERWLTTTGLEKGQTNRSENILKDANRPDTCSEYYGAGMTGAGEATYVDRNYEESKCQELGPLAIKNPNMTRNNQAGKNDHGVDSYYNLPNNRSTTQNQLEFGGVSGVVSAIMAPINDILRPSRKENVVGNLREKGNMQTSGRGNYVSDQKSKPKTTIREMTGERMGMNYLNVEKQAGDGYRSNKQTPVQNHRDTTSTSYVGGGNSQISATRNTTGKHFGTDNVNKSYQARINHGNTQQHNPNVNVTTYRQDCDRENNRMWVPSNMPAGVPSQEFRGSQQTVPCAYPEQSNDRLDPSLLNAFKNNPYTQSLHSCA